MIDKSTETSIKNLKTFEELWAKFHSVYNDTISKGIISKEDERKFLETRSIMRAKYDQTKKTLDFNYMPHSRLTDPVEDVLALDTLRLISEKNLKKLNDDWKDSYLFLNNILEHLKNKKRRLEAFNPVGVFFKRILERA